MIKCQFEDGGEAHLRHVVVEALVLDGDKILLEKRASKMIEGGKWALAGGYMELNETLIEAIKRETLEETGYEIKDLKLLRVIDNPNRPVCKRQNIAFVYFCQVDQKISNHDGEVDDLKWFDLSNLPDKELMAFDHFESIEIYKDFKLGKITLPHIPLK